ncbi:hypothetical protein HA72_0607 [Metallosphaera sedula]|uniref:DUF1404 domain-containing protein n=3 Tax=Metallosphaera TaxID=41980 RepID=A4YED0_METS5|nr:MULTISPECIES: hypothetical protein [Metallosphaera]ABP94782.1 hypothetical protein Msed_0607 [Metallosphaera sedula DSM 5348]AIM26769.1 hypothetical protein HA72_0607 [Metallosphaera sedula]AKV73722.1 hypothetical protein MsedA_0620 [Metallosphaera sedula]AKV75962.1 hypothetical protein MsedB_0620 [Metallosphaera sedula]AKV78213.1 hypothetical protein MsedC_0619 [Metallosphaera sedula]
MNFLKLGEVVGIALLFFSAVIYILGDPLLRLISYQGPILSGGLLGWYVLHSSTPNEKYVEDQDGERVPITSLLIRGRAWLLILVGIMLMVPWFTPQIYSVALHEQMIFVMSFIFQFIGGFIVGYVLPSLKFMEKFILYSLGFGADLFFVLLLYVYSNLFDISQTVLLNNVLVLVYGVKLLEGIMFGVYIVRRINAI